MRTAILALIVCVFSSVTHAQNIGADEALFHSQVDQYMQAHPEEEERVRKDLRPSFLHIQGKWLTETWGQVSQPWTRMDIMQELTINGMSLTYAELKRDGATLRSAQGRLEVDVDGQRLRIIFPSGAEAALGPPSEELSPFRLPTSLSVPPLGRGGSDRLPVVYCNFSQLQTSLRFETADAFLAKMRSEGQRTKERLNSEVRSEYWQPRIPTVDRFERVAAPDPDDFRRQCALPVLVIGGVLFVSFLTTLLVMAKRAGCRPLDLLGPPVEEP